MNYGNINEEAPAPSKVPGAFQNTNELDSATLERVGKGSFLTPTDTRRGRPAKAEEITRRANFTVNSISGRAA